MKHLLATAVFGMVLFLLMTVADYLINAAFGWPFSTEFNLGLALGTSFGFWNWADN